MSDRARVFTAPTEIRRQVGRRRTPWTFALVALVPVITVLAFEFGTDDQDRATGFVGLATASAANFTAFVLLVSAPFLLVVVTALFCGDTVAADASTGSLRYLLAIPVPRTRLLTVKLLVGLLSAVAAVALLTAVALLCGVLAFGWQPMQTLAGDDISTWAALGRVAAIACYVCVTLLTTAAIAFCLSVSTDAPLGAVGGAVLVVVLSAILDQITVLGTVRSVLPTHYQDAFLGLLGTPVQTDDMVRGAVSAVTYTTVFLTLAWWRFHRKDITS